MNETNSIPPLERKSAQTGARSQRNFTIWFGIFIAVLIVNSAFSFRATSVLIENNQLVTHTYRIIKQLDDAFSDVQDAETGQRGFLITGDESYLAPYNSAVAHINGHLIELKSLTAGNPQQETRLSQLEEHIKNKFDELQRVIEVRRAQGLEAARALVITDRGKAEMDEVRRLVAEMEAVETAQLKQREQIAAASGQRTQLTFSFASLLALVLAALTYLLLNRDLARRQRSEELLREANEKLELRVKERTAALEETNEALRSEIAERQRTEEQLQLFAKELERSNRELQDFAFVASHDLQEPLRKIQAFGDRLKSKYGANLSDEGSDYVGRMQNAASRMNVLINDLLTYSRVTTKAQPFAPVDLNAVAREVLSDLETRIEQMNGEIVLENLPTIEADALQMRQLFQNLIGNALKFHRPNAPPVVKISSRTLEPTQADSTSGEMCEIIVEDNGIGFDEKYLDRIFTPFQRLHTRNEYEGTGMGLAVCRKIAERHGGSITARSAPGKGTTFLVRLPIKQATGANIE